MRFASRTLAFVILILLAFWFTAENASELVTIDLAFLRVRASLPLVVFGSLLAGMGLSWFVGWRAERRSRLPGPPGTGRLGDTYRGFESSAFDDATAGRERERAARESSSLE